MVDGINVDIITGLTAADTQVKATGSIEEFLTAATAAKWGLDQQTLRWMLSKYANSLGENRVPFGVGFGKGTAQNVPVLPWGGSGKRGVPNWSRQDVVWAKINVKPTGARVVSFSSTPDIQDSQVLDARKAAEPIDFDVKINDSVKNTTESSWHRDFDIGLSETIGVKVSEGGVEASAEFSMHMDTSWGTAGSTSKEVEVGSELGAHVTLQPGQLQVAALSAYRGSLIAQVDLIATISGFVMAQWCEKHHEQSHNQFYVGNNTRFPNTWHDLAVLMDHAGIKKVQRNTMQNVSNVFANGKAAVYTIPDTDPSDIESAVFKEGLS
ncbi:MAG: hypothetical protein OXI30_07615 [Chloroflexota bacterium]|nr:hypothetical protein [Chloroflexota bacterium]